MNETIQTKSSHLRWEQVRSFSFTRHSRSLVAYPVDIKSCREIIVFARENKYSLCPRGQGYSYADMILNDGHIILDTTRMNAIIHWDASTGILVAQPGVRLADIFRLTLPQLWFLPSCPGGMNVTVAGAVSNNIHGKDSHKTGNFGASVIDIQLLTAQGEILTVSLKEQSDVFKALIGGAGLLGIILQARLQLLKIPSAFVEEETIITNNIEDSLRLMEDSRKEYDFIVGWVDAFAKGKSLGRGYVVRAKWVKDNAPLDVLRLTRSLTESTKVFDIFPAKLFWKLMRPFFGPLGLRWMNKIMYYSNCGQKPKLSRKLFTEFNFMHNKIPDLNYVYYPQGFVEFQPLFPAHANGDVSHVKELFNLCHRLKAQSLLCGIKLHEPDDFLISYEGKGYSIGIDIQMRHRTRQQVNHIASEIFSLTQKVGGKIYLAKDEYLTKEFFKSMYPRWQEFMSIKNRLDPETIFSSDLYRRIYL